MGKLKWSISQSEIYDNLCGGRIKSSNETKLKLEASVTNAKNEQLVRAHASSIIYPKDIRMGFSIPSPAVIHPDMPFMAWVITNYIICTHSGPENFKNVQAKKTREIK